MIEKKNNYSIKTALICGVSGQDGAYLSKLLLKKGYNVVGSSRNLSSEHFFRLKLLGIFDEIKVVFMNIIDFKSVFEVIIKNKPDEIYFLAGQSSVNLSFKEPTETFQSNMLGTLNILEACRLVEKSIKLYFAGSSECFGNTQGQAAKEDTPFNPESPYGVSKASIFWLVRNYRESYNIFACTGILFNHESSLRPHYYVTQKIITSVKKISQGYKEKLYLGNLRINRDWGWAPEYVEAMWLMLQQEQPNDFVIASGKTNSLEYFVEYAFKKMNLNYKDYIILDKSLLRPSDIDFSSGNPQKAFDQLGWSSKIGIETIIEKMLNNEL